MKILAVVGSVRTPSYTRAAVDAAVELLAEKGVDTTVWDLRDRPLPTADPEYHHDPREHPDPLVQELVVAADDASGFLLASPVYHNSYSGVLKNCLDHLAIPQFLHKPVGLISHGGTMSAVQVCDHMRIVVRGLYGIALPRQVVAVTADFGPDGESGYRLVNEMTLTRLRDFVDDFVLFARMFEVAFGARVR